MTGRVPFTAYCRPAAASFTVEPVPFLRLLRFLRPIRLRPPPPSPGFGHLIQFRGHHWQNSPHRLLSARLDLVHRRTSPLLSFALLRPIHLRRRPRSPVSGHLIQFCALTGAVHLIATCSRHRLFFSLPNGGGLRRGGAIHLPCPPIFQIPGSGVLRPAPRRKDLPSGA